MDVKNKKDENILEALGKNKMDRNVNKHRHVGVG